MGSGGLGPSLAHALERGRARVAAPPRTRATPHQVRRDAPAPGLVSDRKTACAHAADSLVAGHRQGRAIRERAAALSSACAAKAEAPDAGSH
jgi:hypothetical protein